MPQTPDNPPPQKFSLWGDLPEARWMYLKAGLFLVAGVVSAGVLLWEAQNLRTAFLLGIALWSFCRLYYFLFYVIEKYIDPEFRFDGVLPALCYLLRRKEPR
ncbi:MAG: hypothetical protein OHK0029_06660 [Armatimonadaceae bacterium]